MITFSNVRLIVPKTIKDNTVKLWADMFNENGIDTKLRLAHFIGQLKCESGNFVYKKELGGAKYLSKYEHRLDLGNDEDGDGIKYCGRGYIQLTGKANYKLFSKWSGLDVLNKPELLETDENAMRVAVWYWNIRKLSLLADKDDVKSITKRINGGYNGLAVREKYVAQNKKSLGL